MAHYSYLPEYRTCSYDLPLLPPDYHDYHYNSDDDDDDDDDDD